MSLPSPAPSEEPLDPAAALRAKGDYTVRVTAAAGSRRGVATLAARRL